MIKTYYRLTKPGIVYGNLLTTVAAYLYASRWHISAASFLATLFGLGLVIASACVCNNYLDRDIDKNMERTKEPRTRCRRDIERERARRSRRFLASLVSRSCSLS